MFFVVLGLLYVATGPSVQSAALHFRIFTASRYLHTVVYLNAVRQPFRALSFMTGLLTLFSMCANVLLSASF